MFFSIYIYRSFFDSLERNQTHPKLIEFAIFSIKTVKISGFIQNFRERKFFTTSSSKTVMFPTFIQNSLFS